MGTRRWNERKREKKEYGKMVIWYGVSRVFAVFSIFGKKRIPTAVRLSSPADFCCAYEWPFFRPAAAASATTTAADATALWSRIAKNPEVSTGSLDCPFAHSLFHSLICLHHSLICSLCTARFARALHYTYSFVCSLTYS